MSQTMTDKWKNYPKEFQEMMTETLIINLNNSECGNCGRGTLPEGKKHLKNSGYGIVAGENDEGCGAVWKYVTTMYMGKPIARRVQHLRPDLEFWSFSQFHYDYSQGTTPDE